MRYNNHLTRLRTVFGGPRAAALWLGLWVLTAGFLPALAQEPDPALVDEAVRRTGLSRQEVLARLPGAAAADSGLGEPGRRDLGGVDDSAPAQPWRDTDVQVVLPYSTPAAVAAGPDSIAATTGRRWFGADFFGLDTGLFTPPTFGPVGADYRLGVGDELLINAWGDLDFQLTRIVDRDGTILLPQAGKVTCSGRTLGEVDRAVRRALARTNASIDPDAAPDAPQGATTVEVTLGRLRAIRIFVVGEAARPGSYELSSVATVLTALYAAGGPAESGSLRAVQLVRGDGTVAELDLYGYLLGGDRSGDERLQEGDTVFIPDRGPAVEAVGEFRRPLLYELKPGETLGDLVRFAGGFTARAAAEVVHILRVLPPSERRPGQPDNVYLDVPFDADAGRARDGLPARLHDGDVVTVGAVADREGGWVEIEGGVKRPGRFQLSAGLTVSELVARAGGLWPDALLERAVLDRTSDDLQLSARAFDLGGQLAGAADPILLEARDVLHVFNRWDTRERPTVHISGEVFTPHAEDFREGMTLRDLVLKAGGLRQGADRLRAEVARLKLDAVTSHETDRRPQQTVEILRVDLGPDFLTSDQSLPLQAYDRVAIRTLPWWEGQRTVQLRGEVFYPGAFSLERKDERLSALIARAGGLKPDAYLIGARVIRRQDGVGNIAIDLMKALSQPGSQFDIVLQDGDEIIVPDRMNTVKVLGEVGFPTSLVFEDGRKIDWYVDRAGGYLELADKKKARVIYPNGLSLPNKGGSRVVAGSTIIVPMKAPDEGPTTLETLKEISAILAGIATVYLVIDKTTN